MHTDYNNTVWPKAALACNSWGYVLCTYWTLALLVIIISFRCGDISHWPTRVQSRVSCHCWPTSVHPDLCLHWWSCYDCHLDTRWKQCVIWYYSCAHSDSDWSARSYLQQCVDSDWERTRELPVQCDQWQDCPTARVCCTDCGWWVRLHVQVYVVQVHFIIIYVGNKDNKVLYTRTYTTTMWPCLTKRGHSAQTFNFKLVVPVDSTKRAL